MKCKFINISLVATALLSLGFSGCNEAPFSDERENGKNKYGEFHKSALTFDVKEEDGVMVQTRATAVNIDDFQLTFLRDGEVERTVDYGDMPEVMLLEQGTYTVLASYGTDLEAEWDNPFFEGVSDEFVVTPKNITTSIDPIVCNLKNVKVSVTFDPELAEAAGDDSYIEVKVKNGKGLQFYKNAKLQEEHKCGEFAYFRINDETTLVATFYGSLYGTEIQQETKSLADISGGNHYKMTFSLHSNNSANQGDSEGNVNIDASVDYENIENNVVVKDQLLNDDSERPSEDEPGGEEPGPGPDEPGDDDPVTPPSDGGPTVVGRDPINLDDWNIATEDLKCVLDVHSDSGITGFKVKINSATLTDEILTGVGLASEFDLITCTTAAGNDVKDGLEGLGLPVAEEVEGQKDVVFDVSQFMGLLGIYGAADHRFILTISDASGTIVKELKLRTE